MAVTYQLEPDLTPAEFIDVLVRSTLAERRPIHDEETIRAMLRNADVILTARLDGVLIGVSRALTDFAYCTYLSELAVDEAYQRQGIGRELIRRTHEAAGLKTRVDPAGGAQGADVLSAHRHDETRIVLADRRTADAFPPRRMNGITDYTMGMRKGMPHAPVAQGIEHRFPKPRVAGSNPAGRNGSRRGRTPLCRLREHNRRRDAPCPTLAAVNLRCRSAAWVCGPGQAGRPHRRGPPPRAIGASTLSQSPSAVYPRSIAARTDSSAGSRRRRKVA